MKGAAVRAMILAAGRGERMRPLTDRTPKPLLPVGGKPLIEWHIERLVAAGIREVVINHAHLGSQIEAHLGNGARWGCHLAYSAEAPALETAGGIVRALPLLGTTPFLVVSGDVWSLYPLARCLNAARQIGLGLAQAWWMMVPNPAFHPRGDFGVHHGRIDAAAANRFTFGNYSVYSPQAFADAPANQPLKLANWLAPQLTAGTVLAEIYDGPWYNLGTPDQLQSLDQSLRGETSSAPT